MSDLEIGQCGCGSGPITHECKKRDCDFQGCITCVHVHAIQMGMPHFARRLRFIIDGKVTELGLVPKSSPDYIWPR